MGHLDSWNNSFAWYAVVYSCFSQNESSQGGEQFIESLLTEFVNGVNQA